MAISMGGGGGPMVEMNTTPLIDVMLVLLIMFIITIPIQTHAVKLDLPIDCAPNCPPPPDVDPVVNRITVDFLNEIYWNGQQVSQDQLAAFFQQSARLEPEPETHVRPDALARYAVVSGIMASAQRNGVSKIGFVGNEAYASLQ